jgi:hypothetical protein
MSATSPSDSPVDAVVSRFSQPVTLSPSLAKWALPAALSMLLTIGCLLMANGNAPASWAWPVSIFFGIGTLLFVLQLVPGAGSLTLDADGFETRLFYFFRNRSRWKNVAHIKVATPALPLASAKVKFVWFNDSRWNGRWFTPKESSVSGYDAGLGDTYGLSAEALADLMNRWREQALAAGST